MKFYVPIKIVSITGNVENIENLLIEKEKQIGLNESSLTTFQGKCSVILDFGVEIRGGLRILTRKFVGDKIRVRLGESVSECNAEIGDRNACNDGAIRDDLITLRTLTDEYIFNSGFRFARIDFSENCTAKIKNIFAYCEILTLAPIFTYNGEDVIIKQIFDCAKRTIDLCAYGDYVWDGIKRDRLVWIGDLYPETLALTALYGRVPQIENSLEFIKNQTPLPNFMNDIPTYSLWWIITLCEYYKRTNCNDFLLKQKDYILGLTELILSHINESGIPDYEGYFIDWQTTSGEEENCGGISLNFWALTNCAFLLKKLELNNEKLNFTIDTMSHLELHDCEKKQIIALKYLAFGKISDKEKNSLCFGGGRGISAFLSFAVLKTIADTVSIEKAIDVMKKYFGAMLSIGATTFFEDFDIESIESCCKIDELNDGGFKDFHGDNGAYCFAGFRKSLCHGWTAGVVDFIKNYCID